MGKSWCRVGGKTAGCLRRSRVRRQGGVRGRAVTPYRMVSPTARQRPTVRIRQSPASSCLCPRLCSPSERSARPNLRATVPFFPDFFCGRVSRRLKWPDGKGLRRRTVTRGGAERAGGSLHQPQKRSSGSQWEGLMVLAIPALRPACPSRQIERLAPPGWGRDQRSSSSGTRLRKASWARNCCCSSPLTHPKLTDRSCPSVAGS
jgi:hypothetical protein